MVAATSNSATGNRPFITTYLFCPRGWESSEVSTKVFSSWISLKNNSLWLLPFFMTMAISCYHKKVRRAIHLDTGRIFNLHKPLRRRPGRFVNVLRTFNIRPVCRGIAHCHCIAPPCRVFQTIDRTLGVQIKGSVETSNSSANYLKSLAAWLYYYMAYLQQSTMILFTSLLKDSFRPI